MVEEKAQTHEMTLVQLERFVKNLHAADEETRSSARYTMMSSIYQHVLEAYERVCNEQTDLRAGLEVNEDGTVSVDIDAILKHVVPKGMDRKELLNMTERMAVFAKTNTTYSAPETEPER